MSDFRTVLIEDSRIADITDKEVFGVQSGASQSTYQQFQAVSASNSSIVFNVQIPSENIVIDRHLLLQTTLNFTVQINGTTQGAAGVPAGQQAFQYGLTDSLQAFPLNSLFTTVQSTINNVSVSSNLQDILPMITRMNDNRMLSRYNSLTPSYVDNQWGLYSNAVLTNSNPLAAYNNNGYDEDFEPRGAYPLESITISHYNAVTATNDTSPISAGTADTWTISIAVQLTEPFLALSPFINCRPNQEAGLLGVNNMSFVLNVDSQCKRLFSTANSQVNGAGNGLSSFITSITLGTATQPNAFQSTKLLFNFLSLQPEQYSKLSTKNVVPYLDYPRYLSISNNNTAIAAGASVTLTSQSIQLNQIPDLIMISVRLPMSTQNWAYTSSFLTINSISINFNNASGLISTATQQDLYNMSFRNGSQQSFYEFQGVAGINNNANGTQVPVPTIGSLLVLNPSLDFSLPSYLSASSLGQYQFQFNINVTNQFPYAITPEIVTITMNSGLFALQQGTAQIFTGILTKQQVLQTKEQNPVAHLESSEYQRLVGGKASNLGMANILKMVQERPFIKQLKSMVGGVTSGGVMSGGVMSGGVMSGGKRASKLDKYLS
jgi:hypothetical protein